MPIRKDRRAWSADELAYLKHATVVEGRELNAAFARDFNARFHGGVTVRTLGAMRVVRTKEGWVINRNPATGPVEEKEQEVKRTEGDGEIDFLAIGRRIKTLDELVAHVKLDLTKYEVHHPEATSWDVTSRDAAGKLVQVQNHRIHFKARLKAGPSLIEQVEAVLDGAFAKRKPVAVARPKYVKSDIMQGVIIADPHIGKLAWGEGTGGPNYDTSIACAVLRDGVSSVMADGDARGVGHREFWVLGDYFHHDGKGMTTKGTPLDYDSRVQKMLREGSEVLFDLIATSASTVPTKVILVPGNHDAVLTWALQRILVSEFRKHKGVTIDDTFTVTKYSRWGKCLIGLDHGEKGKKRLPASMAKHCAVEWGETTLRHFHTGHLHGKAAVETLEGVVVWTHDSLGPADQWHVDERYDLNPRTIEAFSYHSGGMFVGSDAWSPDLNAAPRRGTV